MSRLLRRLFIASCAGVAVAAVLWILCSSRIQHLECSWTAPFDEPGGSGYRQHSLTLRIDRSVMLAHSADWRASSERLAFDAVYEWPIIGPSRSGVRWNRHPSGLNWDASLPAGVFATAGVVPLAAWYDGRRARRKLQRLREAGRCLACGYDLRASKDRCPECGRPIE